MVAFTEAVQGDPRPGYAHAALVALVEPEQPVSEYQRGLINYHAGSYGAAVSAFYRYMETQQNIAATRTTMSRCRTWKRDRTSWR